MAKKKSAKKKTAARKKSSGSRTISLVALHREFGRVRANLNAALQSSPKSPALLQLQQDLTAAEQSMDCAQTSMGIDF